MQNDRLHKQEDDDDDTSDYLVPLPDSRNIAERLINEGAGITIEYSMDTSAPIELRPITIQRHNKANQGRKSDGAHKYRPRVRVPSTHEEMMEYATYTTDRLILIDTKREAPTSLRSPTAVTYATVAPATVPPTTTKLPSISETVIVDGNGNGRYRCLSYPVIDHQTNGECTIIDENSANCVNANNINGGITLSAATLDANQTRMLNMNNAQTDPLTHTNATSTTNSGNNNDIIDRTAVPFTIEDYDRYTNAAHDMHSEVSC